MQNLLNPKWLFVINTLPILMLFFIFYGEFNIIKSLLDKESIGLWKSFALTLAIMGICNFGYGVYLTIKKQNVSFYYGFIALFCYITFIYVYSFHADHIIPLSIPQWMVAGNMLLYVGTFLMPTLAYSLFILVAHFTPETKEHKAGESFLIAIAIPISWYLFSQIILPLWQPVGENYKTHAFLIFLIAGNIIFLFFLVRFTLIIATRKAESWRKYQLAWKIPISIILPLIGLSVNNGHLFNAYGISNSGIFGDFNNYWFYVLAVVNGLFICLPNLESKIYRLFLFIGRSITFAYTFYFFIVFLPFLPLSVIAIVAFGTGFLMLTPLLLSVVHINELSKDFEYLKSHYSKNLIRTLLLIGFFVIPICLTTNYLKDRRSLNQTLEYLYTPDYSKEYDINKASLQKTLNIVKSHKNNFRGGFYGSQKPYLSSYFNWLVLDNLTLSDSKINTIERIFFGKASLDMRTDNIRNDKVEITNISSNSTYDKSQNAWKSWIDLEITNKSGNTRFSEYATTIDLPEGTWISDYYLYMGDKKEMGILAEKKTAMWVFSNIRNENKDPGILYYLTGNKVAFRVFPFAKDEVRKTGIELLHKEPVQLTIDGKAVSLGNSEIAAETGLENENVNYVSSSEKQNLKQVTRKPYFHFLIDATKKTNISKFITRIEETAQKHGSLIENAKVSFVNTYVSTTSYDNDWQQQFQNHKLQGGFYLDRAIKTTLFNAYKSNTDTYPIIIVVADGLQSGIIDKDFSDWSFAFPETDMYYNLNENGILKPYSLFTNRLNKANENNDFPLSYPVLEYKHKDNSVRYLPNNQQSSIVLKSDVFESIEVEIKSKDWNSALTMQAKWTSQILHPERSNEEWLTLVKYSFLSKVMTPVTSYLVVENEAQKAILKKKQEQVLSSNKSLDLGEDTQRMSEPGLLLMSVFLGLLLWYKQRKSKAKIQMFNLNDDDNP